MMNTPTNEIKCEHGIFVTAINGLCQPCRITELEQQLSKVREWLKGRQPVSELIAILDKQP